MTKLSTGEFIAYLRRNAGYTQQYVAEKLNVSDRTLSSWETGRTEPDLLSLTALADLYGVTADEILRGERRSNPEAVADEPQPETLDERFFKFSDRFVKLTVLAELCAAVFFVGCITMLYSTLPLWANTVIMLVGVIGNAVCIATVFKCEAVALRGVDDDENAFFLALRHRAAMSLVFNSLAYIAGAIILFVCYYTAEGYWCKTSSDVVYEFYDEFSTFAVAACAVLAVCTLAVGLIINAAGTDSLGNAVQKAAVRGNRKLLGRISLFGIIPVALSLIPFIVLSNTTFTEVEQVYLTVNGVDELYKKFQTLNVPDDKYFDDGTKLAKGEYYLDFQSQNYVTCNDVLYAQQCILHDLGNNFYAEYYSNYAKTFPVYYLKDGITIPDEAINSDRPFGDGDLSDYFIYYANYDAVSFTSPDGEELRAAVVHYFFKRDEGWHYFYFNLFSHIRDELVLTGDGGEYSYKLIRYTDYSPAGLYAFFFGSALTAFTCVTVHLIKRKKIRYGF